MLGGAGLLVGAAAVGAYLADSCAPASELRAVIRLHTGADRPERIRKRLLGGIFARASWFLTAAAVAVGSPVTATVIVLGGYPIAHAFRLREVPTVRGPGRVRYLPLSPRAWSAMGAALAGMALVAYSTRSARMPVPAGPWMFGAVLAIGSLITVSLNSDGIRWSVEVAQLHHRSIRLREFAFSAALVASGLLAACPLVYAASRVFGPHGSADPAKAAVLALLIACSALSYRVAFATAGHLGGLVVLYATPAVAVGALVGLGLEDVGSWWMLVAGLGALTAGIAASTSR